MRNSSSRFHTLFTLLYLAPSKRIIKMTTTNKKQHSPTTPSPNREDRGGSHEITQHASGPRPRLRRASRFPASKSEESGPRLRLHEQRQSRRGHFQRNGSPRTRRHRCALRQAGDGKTLPKIYAGVDAFRHLKSTKRIRRSSSKSSRASPRRSAASTSRDIKARNVSEVETELKESARHPGDAR